jgi:hypothetical protein
VRAVIDEGDARTTRSLGIKERRLIARHLSHCQPCRRHAKLAGVEDSLLEQPRRAGKIAALLPIPAWLRLRRGGGPTSLPSHSAGLIRSAQGVISANPAAIGGFGRAAAAAVTLVVAGAGTGIVSLAPIGGSSSHVSKPAVQTAPAIRGPASLHAIPAAPRTAGDRHPATVRHSTSASPGATDERPSSTVVAPQSGSFTVSRAGGRRAGAAGSGVRQTVVTGSSAPSHGVAPQRGGPTVSVPPAIGLPKLTTASLPGIVKSTVAGVSGPIETSSLPITGTGAGRSGTAAHASDLVRQTLGALGGHSNSPAS